MLILGLESSAKCVSVALTRDGALVAHDFHHSGRTHSQTLLPMVEDLLRHAGLSMEDVDAIAVAHGPGSFTGVRIGVATAKGLCWGAEKKAIGVSTLAAIAWNGEGIAEDGILCCAMDARRGQVYNALFRFAGTAPERLTVDRAIDLDTLAVELNAMTQPILVLGDGAELCASALQSAGLRVKLAPPTVRYQNAWGVCRASAGLPLRNPAELLPVYLRLSQAERERLSRQPT